jgi:hypothetical protein
MGLTRGEIGTRRESRVLAWPMTRGADGLSTVRVSSTVNNIINMLSHSSYQPLYSSLDEKL